MNGDGHSINLQLPTAASIEALHRKLDDLLERSEIAPSRAKLENVLDRLLTEGDALGFEPLRVYSAKDAARVLGIERIASMYEIPETDLPRVRRIGSSIGFHGINLLAYALRRPPVDVEAAFDRYRETIMKDRPAVRPLNQDAQGLTRVL